MEQEWFEMPQTRRRTYESSVWIPLRCIHTITKTGTYGYEGYISEFFGLGSVAVPVHQKGETEKLGWSEIGISHNHAGLVKGDDYIPANIYEGYSEGFIGENLVLQQAVNSIENNIWHLQQDMVITLGLKQEGKVWVRPDEGYVDVIKMHTSDSGVPYLVEMRASHLRDYLCARGLALYLTSYRSRTEVVDNAEHITWQENPIREQKEMDRWEGRVVEIHEGGMPYGQKTAVFHVARTDVDSEEDVPSFGFPTDDATKSENFTTEHEGKKLYRIEGEFWRNEWINAACLSPIIRGDTSKPTVFFITDAEGTQESKESLSGESRWLWFRPEVMAALAHRRGGSLQWFTKDTGEVGCSPDYSVHFGINKLGLINIYAKDIGRLPDWQQKVWAGYNLGPDGGVSEELLASQMKAKPADTQAPEAYLEKGLQKLNQAATQMLGIDLLRHHDLIPDIFAKTHRFRAIDNEGLFSLAKDLARVTADSIDAKAIQTLVTPPAGENWGSLKSLEKLIASKIDPSVARSMLGSLVGAYKLRHGDAHLPSNDLDEVYALIGIDRGVPAVEQGYQLLNACVESIYGIIKVITNWEEM